MPKADTVSAFGIATSGNAYNFWLDIAQEADKLGKISNILYELQEEYNHIEFSKESFLKHYDWDNYYAENLDPEDVFKYIDFEKGYIEDEATIMHWEYWKDIGGVFEDDSEDNSKANLIIELAVGGPNAHLIYTYTKDEMSPYPHCSNGLKKIEFQYHWWSVTYCIDLTTRPEKGNPEEHLMYEAAQECLDQIYEYCYDNYRAYHSKEIHDV